MRISHGRQRLVLLCLLHLWWLVLSGNYLRQFWGNPVVGGADGSGHVAALHLYAVHVFPGLRGWLPELYGGMPFPVFYPPLFYWLGAAVMRLGGCDASVAAKLLTTLSFAALPGALFRLGRRVGLSQAEACLAAAWAGVMACGSNVASLSGIGLLGLFEVGLYTQTLGFVFFCLWCGSLPYAHTSRRDACIAVVCLAAAVLSNVHVLPLTAAYAAAWLAADLWRGRGGQQPSRRTRFINTLCWLVAPLLLCGVWLLPLVSWYQYSVGRPLPAEGLFASLGGLNVVWPLCAIVLWRERQRPALAALCLALLLTACAALTPLGQVIKWIPFQPARVLSGALLLCTIPVILLLGRLLRELVGPHDGVVHVSLAICIGAVAWIHPMQRFGIAALAPEEAAQLAPVRAAVKDLPPGLILVEIVEPTAVFNSPGASTRELALSRALTHQIAQDGRPVLWSVFREQAVTAPFATAVTNLFSTTKESFGLGGLALARSVAGDVSADNRFAVAAHLGVGYYLVKTPPQIEQLSHASQARLLWAGSGWQLFASELRPARPFEPVTQTPVLAWLPARFKNRTADELDLFNLGEQLALDGHPDIAVLWARSEGVDLAHVLPTAPPMIVVLDPAAVPADSNEWLPPLIAQGSKLSVILLDDGSQPAALVRAQRQAFAGFEQMDVRQRPAPASRLITEVARLVAHLQPTLSDRAQPTPSRWITPAAYFPAWKTADGAPTFLTGQGGMAVLSSPQPVLRWAARPVEFTSLLISLCGLALAIWRIKSIQRRPSS